MDRASEDALREALRVTEAELERLEKKIQPLEALKRERDDKYSLMLQLRANLGMTPYPPASEAPEQKPLWVGAQEMLREAGRAMSVADVAKGLKAKGFAITGKWSMEVVRAAMSRKPEIFERVSRGMFRLKK